MPDSMKSSQEPSQEEIRARAQHIYETEGRPEGKAMEHWLAAESQCRAELKAQAGSSQKKVAKSAPTESATERPANKSRANAPWQAQGNAPRQPAQHN